jgi:hypothetical protein
VAFARFPDLAFGRTLVRDLSSGTLIRADLRDGTDEPGRLGGSYASLSGNGACVAFRSWSDDLVTPSPGPDFAHAYLRALGDCPARPGGGQGGAVADTRAPVISRARVTNRRFVPARGRTARAARVKRGTAFVFRLSEAARTTIVIERRRKRRFSKVVTLTRARTVAGANRVAFTGRVGRRALKRGAYRARLVATDAAGNRSRPVRLTFRVQAARAAPSSARPAMPSLR